MRIRVKRGSERALFRQIADEFVLGLIRDEVRRGTRLPGVRDLARQAGVSVSVASAAYGALEQEGWIRVIEKSGAFATGKGAVLSEAARVRRVVKRVEGAFEEGKALGLSVKEVVRIVKAYGEEVETSIREKGGTGK
ncbi:GntR family transcriptional regulator [Candidatus Sumerlaeota bacterium]|nr:GntR family transcriptional regulator [Candidatus Sumerlaeota bacterium]